MQTLIQNLQSALSKNKADRFAFQVSMIGDVIALAVVKAAPRGMGNPADWKAIQSTLQGAGLARMAECFGENSALLAHTLRGQFRSVAAWDAAREVGFVIASSILQPCAPREATPEQVAARAEKKAKREAEKATATAQAGSPAPALLTGAQVCAAIVSGQFTADELKAIAGALAKVDAGEVIDVVAREVQAPRVRAAKAPTAPALAG